jgi:hypothetical protein
MLFNEARQSRPAAVAQMLVVGRRHNLDQGDTIRIATEKADRATRAGHGGDLGLDRELLVGDPGVMSPILRVAQ